jgi:dihydropteroate synthase
VYRLRVIEFRTVSHLDAELQKLGVESGQLQEHAAKARCRAVKVEGVSPSLAQFLHQELVLEGGDAAWSESGGRPFNAASPQALSSPEADLRLSDRAEGDAAVLLIGTEYQLHHLASHLRTQSESDLDLLAEELERAIAAFNSMPPPLKIGSRVFEWGRRTYVMGILNLTPDSFSGDGILRQGTEEFIARASARAEMQVADGADILDIGGESTRPGSQPTPVDEELGRVIPVLERIRPRISIPISVDTYKAQVARAALDAGADLVNDVWGLRMDPEMARVVADRDVPVVIMHNRSKPKDAAQSDRLGGRYIGVEYGDLLGEVIGELRGQIEMAVEAGIARDKIIVDPGIGFGKTLEQNLELLDRTEELRVLGCPILVGVSRKGFIGYTLNLPVEDRMEGTAAAVALGIIRGADMVRVHDVKQMVRVARMTDAIIRRT